jgi:hypothetical protein
MIARFEILPFGRGVDEAAELPEHVRLTVTASPTHVLDQTVETGTRLRALGHSVTLHLAARMIRDRAHLDSILATMAHAGIDDAFVIGGDATPPVGLYSSAADLLPLIHEHPQRPRTIGIAGYPEGHPLIDSTTLTEALEQKSQRADYIATQLCFDPKVLLEWVRGTRREGIGLPVVVTRFFNIVGPRQTGRYGMVLPNFIQAALERKPIRVFGDGLQSRNFTFIGDCLDAVLLLLFSKKAEGEIVNIGSPHEISILELAERVRYIAGSSSPIIRVPYAQAYPEGGFEDMRRRVPCICKIARLTGWAPHTTIDEMITHTIGYERRILSRPPPAALTLLPEPALTI